jgi:hypothetical protein
VPLVDPQRAEQAGLGIGGQGHADQRAQGGPEQVSPAVVVAEPGSGRVELGGGRDPLQPAVRSGHHLVDLERPLGLGPAGHGQQLAQGLAGRRGGGQARQGPADRQVEVVQAPLGNGDPGQGGHHRLGHREHVGDPRPAVVPVEHGLAVDLDPEVAGLGIGRLAADRLVDQAAGVGHRHVRSLAGGGECHCSMQLSAI